MARQPNPAKPFLLGDSIADILAEAGIQTGRTPPRPGSDVKLLCPACGGGKSREQSLSVKVDADGMGAAWHCFRGNCPGGPLVPGSGRIESAEGRRRSDEPVRRERAEPKPPPAIPDDDDLGRPAALVEFFERRGISEETLAEFGVHAVTRRWPTAGGNWIGKPTIVFPYRQGGQLVNRKYRSPDKEFMQDKDAARTLFNIDAVESDDEVVFVEGEMDVLAMWEAGYRQVVSLPDGSPQKLLDEDDPKRQADKRFDALEDAKERLAKVKRIFIATDMDEPGKILAEELARRLGKARCWLVEWPKPWKDANDVWHKGGGRAAIDKALEHAQPYPLAGHIEIRPGQLIAYRQARRGPRALKSGLADLDAVARMPFGGGWLTVLTGIPSHGKSTLLRNWLVRLAAKHDYGVIWCSPEDNTPENLALGLASLWTDQPAFGTQDRPAMSDADLAAAEQWIAKRFTFIGSDDPDEEMTLDWVLARAGEAVKRHRRNLLCLDPWNEFEHQWGRQESETQYVNRWLRKLKAWGRAHACDVLICAHPTKLQKDPKTKKYPVAEGYDINGGAGWKNKADLGVTVYRREEGMMEVHNWKVRFGAFGKQFEQCKLEVVNTFGKLRSPGFTIDERIA